MISEEFWSHIAVFDGVVTSHRCTRLAKRLAAAGEPAVLEFADDLAAAVYALDTPQHMARAVWDVSEPADSPSLPMSDDVFLYARLAVVAAGLQTWQRVAADADALSGRWQVASAEELLEVAPRALQMATGLDWDHETAVDMAAGSNAVAWGTIGVEEDENEEGPHWYSCGHGYDENAARDDFDTVSYALEKAIDSDPVWQAWWSSARVADLETYPYYTWTKVPKPRLGKGRRVVRVDFEFDAAILQSTSVPNLPRLAAEHQRMMLQFVQSKLGLPEIPPLPVLP
ncbi:DUF4240 domain-containing protein [Micromonospora rubida]|uniref:DUF4240 domain-containing protein n=1 Tax=Micromonospora rubida TaxID=2697657 RepID=UPI0013770D62|nr:DUF4240 domain-containing protein [Micromonospora rubida]NBE79941.1 DUF4240 domain-containing protein [Micromonospora rubida]